MAGSLKIGKERSVSVLIHDKETARVVGKLVKRRDGNVTYANMQVGGSGTQAVGHVQAGSGVAQQRLP